MKKHKKIIFGILQFSPDSTTTAEGGADIYVTDATTAEGGGDVYVTDATTAAGSEPKVITMLGSGPMINPDDIPTDAAPAEGATTPAPDAVPTDGPKVLTALGSGPVVGTAAPAAPLLLPQPNATGGKRKRRQRRQRRQRRHRRQRRQRRQRKH